MITNVSNEHITSTFRVEVDILWPLNSVQCCLPIEVYYLRFKVLMAVKMLIVVLWVVTPCSLAVQRNM
jgi:hypothetical protein